MCRCLERGVGAALRDEVLQAESEYLARLSAREKIHYAELIERWKHSWGLCPECDKALRMKVFEAARSNIKIRLKPLIASQTCRIIAGERRPT